MSDGAPSRPVLLCFDGSSGAERAIAEAGALLAPRAAVVLTVWEPVAVWEPYDPVGLVSGAVARLGSLTTITWRGPPSWSWRSGQVLSAST